MAIDPVSPSAIGTLSPAGDVAAPAAAPGGSPFGAFGDGLSKLLASVDSSAGEANTAVSGMIDGSGDVHTAMIALQRAEMNLQLTVQIRNKLVQAYQDVMRMTI
jgi:flagellar hook-basal body complex protein FliE